MATVNGKNLVVKWGTAASEVAIACSTTCTLTISQAMTEATCKDADSWTSQIEGQKSWEITVDALYQESDAVGTSQFIDLADLIIQDTATANSTSVVFEQLNNPLLTTTNNMWSGLARMTSCNLTGDDNSPATYSATFVGNGPLTFTAGTEVP